MVNHFIRMTTIFTCKSVVDLASRCFFRSTTMQCTRRYPKIPTTPHGGLTIPGIGADFHFSIPTGLYVWSVSSSGAKILRSTLRLLPLRLPRDPL